MYVLYISSSFPYLWIFFVQGEMTLRHELYTSPVSMWSSRFHQEIWNNTGLDSYFNLFHSTYLSEPVWADARSKSNSFCVAFFGSRIGNGGMIVFFDFIASPASRVISLNRCFFMYRPNMASTSRTMSRANISLRKSASDLSPRRTKLGVIGRKRLR